MDKPVIIDMIEDKGSEVSLKLTQSVFDQKVYDAYNREHFRTRMAVLIISKEEFVKKGYKEGDTLPGRIYHLESTTPPEENPNSKLLYALISKDINDCVICLDEHDQPIFRLSFYSEDLSLSDEYIRVCNQEEIMKARHKQSQK